MITEDEMKLKIAEAEARGAKNATVGADGERFLRRGLVVTLEGVRRGEYRQGEYDAGILIFNQFMGIVPGDVGEKPKEEDAALQT